MTQTENFEGLGQTHTESLQKYGFVCRNEKSDQYYCLYKINDFAYDEGFIRESEIQDLLNEEETFLPKEELKNFFTKNVLNKEQFNDLTFLQKLQKIINFFGTEAVFGKQIQNLSIYECLNIIERE